MKGIMKLKPACPGELFEFKPPCHWRVKGQSSHSLGASVPQLSSIISSLFSVCIRLFHTHSIGICQILTYVQPSNITKFY